MSHQSESQDVEVSRNRDELRDGAIVKESLSDAEVNREFNKLTIEVLGEVAKGDQTIPLKDRLGSEPRSGALVVPDPGDLEPLHYPNLSEKDMGMLPIWAKRAHAARRAFDSQVNPRSTVHSD